MSWEQTTTTTDAITEWTRSDGYVTIRKRMRTDGQFAVRVEKLEQAPGGREYEQTIAATEQEADSLCEKWQRQYDV